MSSIFSKPKRPKIIAPNDEDEAAAEAARKEAERLRKKRKGRLATILTGSEGLTGTANTYKTTLG